MNSKLLMGIILVVAALTLGSTRADIAWIEDFSDVSDWHQVFNAQSDGSMLGSDGSVGTFYVESISNEVAFAPNPGSSPFLLFVPANKADYSMSFTASSLSPAVSYDIRLDMFDAGDTYLGTVYGVVPQGTFVGSDTIGLGGFVFDNSTAKLLPKVSVFTGPAFGEQTVSLDEIRFDVIPEPTSAVLIFAGAILMGVLRRSRSTTGRRAG